MNHPLLVLLLGVAAGVLSGLFGIGGGAVLVPALVMLLGYGVAQAAGISLAALLLPVGILGVWEYVRSGRLDRASLGVAAWVALGLFLGTWFGARLGEQVSGHFLRRGMALLLVAVAVRLWLGSDAGS